MNRIKQWFAKRGQPPQTVIRGTPPSERRSERSVSEFGDTPLPTGTLVGRYRLSDVLGRGGFGYTYRAVDERLGGEFAIKEYLPRGVAIRRPGLRVGPISTSDAGNFSWGLSRFLEEARTLRQLTMPVAHPNVVAVRDYLEEFGTGYMIMDFCEGRSLAARLGQNSTLEQKPLCALLGPLLDALAHLHAASVVHRDIKPDNICLRTDDTPVLIDFGAAKHSLGERSQTVTMILTPGYSPVEQYLGSGRIGPWTDLYALGATLYRAISGHPPLESLARWDADELTPAKVVGQNRYAPRLLEAIDAALTVRAADRPQSVSEWRSSIADLLQGDGADQNGNTELDHRTVEEFLTEQSVHYAAERFEQALASVRQARRVHGERPIFWNNQGIFLSDMKRYREALDCFEHGLELNPNYQNLWCNKGRALRAMGRPLEALVCYDRAIPIDPKEPTPWDCKGNCLLDIGRRDEAKECFNRVLELDPNHPTARSKLSD